MDGYRPRLVDPLLDDLLTELPALFLVGPRATGKTTTAARRARSVVRLDRPGEAGVVAADPDAALRGLEEPILIDEWQVVPDVLGAVKRAVDADWRPARFLVTGSARGASGGATWPGTGRLVQVDVYGMTIAEQLGLQRTTFVDALADGEELRAPADQHDLRDYVELVLRSGFPEAALELSGARRDAWLESYVAQVVTRDIDGSENGRDRERLRRYLEAYALSSAGVAHDVTLQRAAEVTRPTALAYERLLAGLFVTDMLPSWTSNRLKRLVRSPKRYLVDAALLTAVLRIDVAGILRDADLLGRLLDTFVASQLRAELQVTRARPRLFHVREEHGRYEIDILAELGGGRVVAFEVKATAAPQASDARHLVWLRDRLEDRFLAGVLFHTGPRVFSLGDRIIAAPIATLWGPTG